MKKNIFVLFIVLILTGCPENERTIEDVLFYTTEKNSSSYDLFIQYYLENGKITRKNITKDMENRTHFYYGDTVNYQHLMYENNYLAGPDSDPQLTYYEPNDLSPNEKIKKIIIIDINTNTIIKRIEDVETIKNVYVLDKARDNYNMRVRLEYWLFEITDEWLKG